MPRTGEKSGPLISRCIAFYVEWLTKPLSPDCEFFSSILEFVL